ncbi:hypothetical protein AVEN_109882-1 [Araneus ventricosus]|uniref:Uncharacterized protein n=1 Tax=Araneus ventricosus TaxID=182803 RepID=A0A4Y2LVE3_ARAVE|nr:hypothetical protein AVEN_84396-1 [Araneus ventricosus]GBN18033.1 hypothetical protein AVEN_109882-1 [Araneus ventricosus]
MSLSFLAIFIVGEGIYRGKHGETDSGHSKTPDLGDKSMIPENATLSSISLLGTKISSNVRENPCDVAACRREYIRAALGSVRCVHPLERTLEFRLQCELESW